MSSGARTNEGKGKRAAKSGGGVKKTKAKGKKKDPNAPKRPKSGWIIYSTKVRPEFKKKHADASFGELTQKISEKWKTMTADDKKPYEEEAAKDKKRYEAENKAYQAKKGDDDDDDDDDEDEKPKPKAKGKAKKKAAADDDDDDDEDDDDDDDDD